VGGDADIDTSITTHHSPDAQAHHEEVALNRAHLPGIRTSSTRYGAVDSTDMVL